MEMHDNGSNDAICGRLLSKFRRCAELTLVVALTVSTGCASGRGAQSGFDPGPSPAIGARAPAHPGESFGEVGLEPGDLVRVRLSREPGLSGDYGVDESGSVGLPLLGTRRVDGVSADRLTSELRDEYEAQVRNQTVEVRLLRRIRVLGAVNVPGLYHVDATMSLGDAVALAGGATDDGKLGDIRIFREDRELRSDLRSGYSAVNYVHSGDQIIVPRRSWLSRNLGAVLGATITGVALVVSQVAF